MRMIEGICLGAAIFLVTCIAVSADHRCTSKAGNCRYTSQNCIGSYKKGLCAGAYDRQCCVPSDVKCHETGGQCQVTSNSCSGSYISNLCTGSSSRKCCVPRQNDPDGKCHAIEGQCQDDWNFCSGSYVSGLCGGSNSRRCCAPELCISRICGTINRRLCDALGCGHWGASRGSRTHKGEDLKCTSGAMIVAPFPGKLSGKVRPYGNGKCCDTGFDFVGTGAWAGKKMRVFYAEPATGRYYQKGDVIAQHVGLISSCGGRSACYSSRMTDHIHVEIHEGSTKVDPNKYFC